MPFTTRSAAAFAEARVGAALEVAGDEGEGIGQDVVVGAVGVLGGDAGAAVGGVEVAVARGVFPVVGEGAVVAAARVVAASGRVPFFSR